MTEKKNPPPEKLMRPFEEIRKSVENRPPDKPPPKPPKK